MSGDRAVARQDRSAHGEARFFSQEVQKMSAPDRRSMLDRADRTLSLRRQRRADAPDRRTVHCLALSRLAPDNGDAARGGRVCEPEARPAADASDGIAALGPKPRTSKPAHGHKIYPYLLRNLTIERANHVWAADITSIRSGAESTGRRARCLRGGCRTRWTFRSVWRRSRSASEVRQAGDFNTGQGSQFT
jgi:hypothetical protein